LNGRLGSIMMRSIMIDEQLHTLAQMQAFLNRTKDQLQTGLLALENHLSRVKSIVALDWIVNALLKLKWNLAHIRCARGVVS
jgi:hypothetical protein